MTDQSDKPTIPDWLKSLFSRRELLSSRDEPEPGPKGFVIALCILTASLLWFAFSMQETYLQVIKMPVQVNELPEGRSLLNLPPSHVRVQVEGEGVQLLRLYYNPPPIQVSVTSGSENQDMHLAVSEEVSNVSVQSVTPRTISIATDEEVSRALPVRSRVEIRPAPSFYLIGEPRIEPDTVTVSGAASIVSALDSWPTEARLFEDVRDPLQTGIALADSLPGLLKFDSTEVELFANVQEFSEDNRSLRVQVRDAPPNQRVSLDPPAVTVRYRVPLEQYDEAAESPDFIAYVTYDEIRSDTSGVLYPHLDWPDELHIRDARVEPDALRYYNVLGEN